jgi:large subunit ribosomal protein L19
MNMAQVLEAKANPNIPQLAPGDTVKVYTKIIEGEKARTQVFQGIVIKQKKTSNGVSFTVRHVAYGIGVERIFPSQSPLVEKVEVVRHGKVRRARLYYLRNLSGKASRIKEKRFGKEELEAMAAQAEAARAAEAQALAEVAAKAAPAAAPAAEAPKAEAPKAAPKTEAPKSEAPKAQEAQKPPEAKA